MPNKEKNNSFQTVLHFINQFLPVLFWCTLILGFEEIHVALLSLLSAILHEGGHVLFLRLRGIKNSGVRGAVSGFRIKSREILTYNEEVLLYFSGPLVNLICASIASLLQSEFGELFCMLNLATAISNLLPVAGYDGYGIIRALIEKLDCTGIGLRILNTVSSTVILSFCIISIYFIDRYGSGYWIFGIFFISMLEKLKKWLKNTNCEN